MGSLGTIITVIIVVAWVVKGLASMTGNDEQADKSRKPRSLEQWDELQSQRREQLSSQQQALSDARSQASRVDTTQLTMAERIELARQRARQQAGVADEANGQAEALRRARLQAEQQAQAQRQQAQQRAAQQRAAQERAVKERQRLELQRRRQLAQQQAQAQQRQTRAQQTQRRPSPAKPATARPVSTRQSVVAQSVKRVHEGHDHQGPRVQAPASAGRSISAHELGLNNRKSLRKAFIMKELLDKPLALRDPRADLLS